MNETQNEIAAWLEQQMKAEGKYVSTEVYRGKLTGTWHTTVTMRDPETGHEYEIDVARKVA